MYDAPNAVEELKRPRSHPTAEIVEAIKDAFETFWNNFIRIKELGFDIRVLFCYVSVSIEKVL